MAEARQLLGLGEPAPSLCARCHQDEVFFLLRWVFLPLEAPKLLTGGVRWVTPCPSMASSQAGAGCFLTGVMLFLRKSPPGRCVACCSLVWTRTRICFPANVFFQLFMTACLSHILTLCWSRAHSGVGKTPPGLLQLLEVVFSLQALQLITLAFLEVSYRVCEHSESIHSFFKREKCPWQSRESHKQQQVMPELHPLKNVKSAAVDAVPDCFYSCKIIRVCRGGPFPATGK